MPLTVTGSDQFVELVQRMLQRLDPTAYVTGGRVWQDPHLTADGRIHGHELIRRLVTSGHGVEIHSGPRCECIPTYRHGGKTGSRVTFNPSQVCSLTVGCPAPINLGHELIHSDQLIRGVQHYQDVGRVAGSSQSFSMRLELLCVLGEYQGERDRDGITENDLRAELGFARRPFY